MALNLLLRRRVSHVMVSPLPTLADTAVALSFGSVPGLRHRSHYHCVQPSFAAEKDASALPTPSAAEAFSIYR